MTGDKQNATPHTMLTGFDYGKCLYFRSLCPCCALVGMLGSLLVSNRIARIEERKHFRELGIKIALVLYNECKEAAQKNANASGITRTMPPFTLFLINGIRTMEIVGDTRLTAEEVGRRTSEFFAFYKDVAIIMDQQTHGNA